jgi:hypothetical protein
VRRSEEQSDELRRHLAFSDINAMSPELLYVYNGAF